MLSSTLIHPPLIGALAAAGHGTRVLLGDGNFPYSSHSNPAADLVHLNLRPGTLEVIEVLETLMSAVAFEHAVMMDAGETDVPAQREYQRILGPDVTTERVGRFAFYDLARSHETAVVVATGDERLYANILLTIGVRG